MNGADIRKMPMEALTDCLPLALQRELVCLRRSIADFDERLSELRLRAGRASALTVGGECVSLMTQLTRADMDAMLGRFCRHSVYAYGDTLCEGYIRFSGGFRIGVAGCAVKEQGRVVGIKEVSSFCIRIAHAVPGAGRVAADTFRRLGGHCGLLIYSPPGVGKTTLLRDMADTLSRGRDALRVAVVDCRGEICGGTGCLGTVDVLEEYSKAKGIEIATRTLAPQLIICDEIGGYDEAESILAVQSCGVPLVASVHGDSLTTLLARPAIGMLDQAGVFGAYIGIRRCGQAYTYQVDIRDGKGQVA